ncbi:MAG TPA: amidoligase family protein [Tepidisphaeraceae bacterium]|nr:amidoligase family protein [Tepidisphaeraceae bacterium]
MLTAELNRTRRIGCEYEMTVPLVGTGSGRDVQETLARVLTANGIRAIARGYDHSLLPNGVDVAVEYDSSVQGESRWAGVQWYPVEIKTRILNGIDDWEQVVPKMLEICRYMGARVNTSTGHHIHLAFDEVNEQPRTVRSLWNVFHRFEPVIFGLVAPSRRQNSYCRPLPANGSKLLHGANSIRALRRKLDAFDRYYGLNLTHLFDSAPRLELRYHQGTLNVTTARMWLRLCLSLVQHSVVRNAQAAAVQANNDRRGIEALMTVIGLKVNTKVYSVVTQELRECGRFMLKRWKGFNGNCSLRETKAATSTETAEVD